MSSTPTSKRRRRVLSRVLTASNTLTQPFKSPLLINSPKTQPSVGSPAKTAELSGSAPTAAIPKIIRDSSLASIPPQKTSHRPHSLITTSSSSDLRALQKKHTALLNSLTAARADLETLTQALKLEDSSTDKELETLIQEWTIASRAAAEVVFGGVKERVDRMGGVRGWKEMERRKREGNGWGWEENLHVGEEEHDSVYVGKKTKTRAEIEERAEREGNGEAEGRNEEDYEEEEEQEFSMDMMLQSLNIDLGIIGYSKELQGWID